MAMEGSGGVHMVNALRRMPVRAPGHVTSVLIIRYAWLQLYIPLSD